MIIVISMGWEWHVVGMRDSLGVEKKLGKEEMMRWKMR